MQAVEAAATADAGKQPGFSVSVDDAVVNAFTVFERHVQRGSWEKAFRALEEPPAEKRKGTMPTGDGFIVPARQRIWDALVALPADGRAAFRVFQDAAAVKLFKSLEQPEQVNK